MPTWPSRTDRKKKNPNEQIVLTPKVDEETKEHAREREREKFMGQRDKNYTSLQAARK